MKQKVNKAEETIYYMETWDGALVRVPASKAEMFMKDQEVQRKMAEQGKTLHAPDAFTEKLSDAIKAFQQKNTEE